MKPVDERDILVIVQAFLTKVIPGAENGTASRNTSTPVQRKVGDHIGEHRGLSYVGLAVTSSHAEPASTAKPSVVDMGTVGDKTLKDELAKDNHEELSSMASIKVLDEADDIRSPLRMVSKWLHAACRWLVEKVWS